MIPRFICHAIDQLLLHYLLRCSILNHLLLWYNLVLSFMSFFLKNFKLINAVAILIRLFYLVCKGWLSNIRSTIVLIHIIIVFTIWILLTIQYPRSPSHIKGLKDCIKLYWCIGQLLMMLEFSIMRSRWADKFFLILRLRNHRLIVIVNCSLTYPPLR